MRERQRLGEAHPCVETTSQKGGFKSRSYQVTSAPLGQGLLPPGRKQADRDPSKGTKPDFSWVRPAPPPDRWPLAPSTVELIGDTGAVLSVIVLSNTLYRLPRRLYDDCIGHQSPLNGSDDPVLARAKTRNRLR